MRHKISGRKLNRKTSHRIALLKNLAKSLIINEQIETTLPKAKDLRPFVEKILHTGKSNNLHSKRKVFSYLRDKTLFGLFSSTFSLLIVLLIIHKGLFGDLDSLFITKTFSIKI